jgi:hypothetical protein
LHIFSFISGIKLSNQSYISYLVNFVSKIVLRDKLLSSWLNYLIKVAYTQNN